MQFIRRRYSVVLAVLALLTVAVVAAAVEQRRATVNNGALPARATSTPRTSTIDQTRQRGPEAELLIVTPAGFEPAEITRPRGTFVLVIDDRSGLENISLRLDHLAAGSVRNLRMERKKQNGTMCSIYSPEITS